MERLVAFALLIYLGYRLIQLVFETPKPRFAVTVVWLVLALLWLVWQYGSAFMAKGA